MKRRKLMQRMPRSRSIAGFTLLELLVVIVIIGILFAIAAPGWDALLSRQRVSTARQDVVLAIEQAQSRARQSRTPQVVVVDPTAAVARVAVVPYVTGSTPTVGAGVWKTLGGGDISPGVIQVAVSTASQIVFDSNGAVAQRPVVPADQTLPFSVTVKRQGDAGNGTKRCVVIRTLLGATSLQEGSQCPL